MGRNFRPVKTLLGARASCFIPSDYVVRALEALADLAGCEWDSNRVQAMGHTEVWISDGKLFFDFLKQDTTLELADGALDLILLSEEEAAEDPGDETTATEAQFTSFMNTLRANADDWLAKDLDPTDGSIRFYVD